MNGPNNFRYWRWVGLNLRQARERKALTLKFCAQQIGVLAEDILNIENGNAYLIHRKQQNLAKILKDYEKLLDISVTTENEDTQSTLYFHNSSLHASDYIPSFLRAPENSNH